ncbi:MAG TPA: hypothetical protein VMT26_03175 [Candidatus Bathyarchaeia archaeon]|jgi:hypothetical protein|nr:hypothetical protein [Candidatus Bathyarchaeia archaeon]
MPKKPTLEDARKKLEAKTSEIKEEYERKIKELEAKIEQHKGERDTRLIRAEKRFRKDFCVTFKGVVGEEDYNWLSEWLMKNREKEIEEAEKKHETKRANELKEMSVEDYLFRYFNYPKIEGRLKKDMEQSKSEEAKRLSFILAKLKLEKLRVERTT